MGNGKLVEVLVAKCLKDIGTGENRILAGHAASWFEENVKEPMTDGEWAKLLYEFTDYLKTNGYLTGH